MIRTLRARRKNLKFLVLYRLNDAMNVQEKAKDGKDTTVKIKSFDQLEKKLVKNY